MPVRPSVVPLVSCALLAGLLNVATATLRRPTIHREEMSALLAFVSVGVALALLAEATLWMLARPWVRRQALAAPATSLAIGVGVVALAAVSPLWSSVSQMGSPERWAVLLALLGGVCLASLWSYGLAAGASDRLRALGDAVALAAPGIGAGALACVWVLVFRIEDLTSAASLLSLLAFAGGVAVCLAVAARARESVPRSGTLIAILVGVLALPWLWVYLPGRSVVRPVPSAESPSVLFVTVDTLRADAVDLAAGNPRTPALARLAA
jgi:putative flippase GtrA